ncbi:MAG TPA: condensation domain-containing protein, partial [Gemmataceae bacterium]|nr:condensation domain-containing protein [Gemmataceae bacterium]
MAEVWADVLGRTDIGPDDDFFNLGGDSLAGMQILARLTQRDDPKLTEADLYAARTVRGLAALLTRREAVGSRPSAIRPVAGPRTRFPATSAQQRLWVLDHIIPSPEVYNVQLLVRMSGPLDLEALRVAFERVEERHEALRVHFETEDGLPVQVVGPCHPFALPVTDLRAHGPEAGRDFAIREAAADAARHIALDGDRLWNVKLYRTADEEHYLWLNLHHTITDGWSLGVFFTDLEAYYKAAPVGTPCGLDPLAVHYGDYAAWEAEFRQSGDYRDQVQFWKRTLAPPLPALDLPFSKPRPVWQNYHGERVRFEVRPELVAGMDRLCRELSVTRFMVGLASFQTVLHRYTGQDTVLLGTPAANRTRKEVEPLLGLFVNTLVLRTSLAGDPTFRELLERVRRTRLDALDHQDVSLEALIEELRPPRDPGRQPFFQAAFYYQNVRLVPDRFACLQLEVVPVPTATAMFDLRLVLEDGPDGGLWGWAEFNTDVLEADHVTRLVGHFETVLAAAIRTPTARLSEFPLLPPAERQRILFDWNRTAGDYPADDCLPDAFARRATETPNAPAVVAGGRTVTYRQLYDRSNRLAQYLKARGIKPGDLVGVCLKRSADMVAAVLAVTKAGAGYIPLDPGYPKDRLAFMLDDTKAALVLTQW